MRWGVFLVGFLALALALPPTPAVAGTTCSGATCDIVIDAPAIEGDSSSSGGSGGSDEGSTDFTPGPTQCNYTGPGATQKQIDCGRGDMAWSNTDQCYWGLHPSPPPPPPGASPSGAWYSCTPYNCGSSGQGCQITTEWRDSPPPGITVLSPAQAAQRLIQSFTLEGLDIGMAPRVNEEWGHRRSYIGVPIWLWAASKTELNWGTFSKTATLGGQTITANARVSSVQWNMGDGGTVTCGEGTAYNTGFGNTPSPSCGYKYTRTSGGGMFTVTATSNWVVEWSGGGQTGTIPLTTTSSTQVEIRELQSVNVPNPGPNGP